MATVSSLHGCGAARVRRSSRSAAARQRVRRSSVSDRSRVLILLEDAGGRVGDLPGKVGDLEGVLLLERPLEPLVGDALVEELLAEEAVPNFD